MGRQTRSLSRIKNSAGIGDCLTASNNRAFGPLGASGVGAPRQYDLATMPIALPELRSGQHERPIPAISSGVTLRRVKIRMFRIGVGTAEVEEPLTIPMNDTQRQRHGSEGGTSRSRDFNSLFDRLCIGSVKDEILCVEVGSALIGQGHATRNACKVGRTLKAEIQQLNSSADGKDINRWLTSND